MKLSRLYSNRSDLFRVIDFVDGLNVIVGRISKKGVFGSDSHNLGKSTLCQIIDFCLGATVDNESFVKKAGEKLSSFIFFLELEIQQGRYLTIRRSLERHSKISLLLSNVPRGDYSTSLESEWTYWEVAFQKGKKLIEAYLGWDIPCEFSYRQYLMYLLRRQDEYRDVFEISRYSAKQVVWKPILSQMLGLEWNAQRVLLKAQKEAEELRGKLAFSSSVVNQLSYPTLSECDEKIQRIDSELKQLEDAVKVNHCREISKCLSSDALPLLEASISKLQEVVFRLKRKIALIEDTLRVKYARPTLDLETIFNEVKLFFPGHIKESYESLVQFNHDVFYERKKYLSMLKDEYCVELRDLSRNLEDKCEERDKIMDSLRSNDVTDVASSSLKRISDLNRWRQFYVNAKAMHKSESNLREKMKSHSELNDKYKNLITSSCEDEKINSNVMFNSVQDIFSEFIFHVINKSARISIETSIAGNYDFKSFILDADGNTTYESDGNTYKKLLCIAFDVALICSHLNISYPHFVFHDGAFEAVDDKCKVDLMNQISIACSKGIQYIVTMIDSDLPFGKSLDDFIAGRGKVVLELSDEDDRGLLFKGIRW